MPADRHGVRQLFLTLLLCGLAGAQNTAEFPAGTLSVRDFGARGDGSDATAEIAAALTAASGKSLYFPEGVYVSKPLTVPAGTKLWCTSHQAILKLSDGSNHTFITLMSGAELSGCTVDGNIAHQSAFQSPGDPQSTGGVKIMNGSNAVVSDNHIKDVYGTCVFGDGAAGTITSPVVRNNIITGCKASGVFLRSDTDYAVVTENRISALGDVKGWKGIGISGARKALGDAESEAPLIQGNVIDLSTVTGAQGGLLIETWGGVPRARIIGNAIHGDVGYTDYCISVDVSDFSVVVSNTITHCHLGIEVAGSSDVTVSSNTISDLGPAGGIGSGMWIDGVSRIPHRLNIIGNVFDSSAAQSCIEATAGTNFNITANTFIDCATYWVFLNGAGQGSLISGNKFIIRNQTRPLASAVYSGSNDVVISGNTFIADRLGTSRLGLVPIVVGGDAVTVTGNVFDGLAPTGGAMAARAVVATAGATNLYISNNIGQNFSTGFLDTSGVKAPVWLVWNQCRHNCAAGIVTKPADYGAF